MGGLLEQVPDVLQDVAAALAERRDATRARLASLVSIASISAAGHDPSLLERSAEATAAQLRDAGLQDVQLLTADSAPPYVFAQRIDSPDAPTVLLYAHHDVQPVPSAETWTTPPFQPTQRDGRLYGRGTADDKGGIAVHVAAVEAWVRARGRLPVNVKVIVEGEEEIGSPNMAAFLRSNTELLRADVVVICDSANWQVGWPSLTYTTRGIAEVYVTVRALKTSIHSGASGPVPDAISGLVRALHSLKDERGGNAVAGLGDDARVPSLQERQLMRDLEATGDAHGRSALLDGVQTTGDPEMGIFDRMWAQPAITVVGLDVPSVEQATNQLVAEARAKVSIRLAPGQDPQRAANLVAGHLRNHVPWGMQVDTRIGAGADGWVTEPQGRVLDAARRALTAAYGREPAIVGTGGTLPLLTLLAETYPAAPCLLTAVADPGCRAHGTDESVDLGELDRACLAEALLLAELAS